MENLYTPLVMRNRRLSLMKVANLCVVISKAQLMKIVMKMKYILPVI